MQLLDQLWGQISYDIGIDLGTANTLVFVGGKGIMVREPTVIAQHKKTKQVLAVGAEAKRMLGKTPVSIGAVRPLKDGVISDLEASEALLKYFIKKVHHDGGRGWPKIPRPRVAVGIPSGVTEVERRAVIDAAAKAGAREVFLIEEPMAAALGAKLPIEEARGSMIVDIGGGTSEIAVISLGGLVISHSLRVAGDEMDQDIINYARSRYNILLGEKSAEEIKINSVSGVNGKSENKIPMSGRDLETGLPTTIMISPGEVREAISETVFTIIEAIKDTIEETPPELLGDIVDSGITLTGGGSLLPGFAETLKKEARIPVNLVDDPLTSVVVGTARVLAEPELFRIVKTSGGLK